MSEGFTKGPWMAVRDPDMSRWCIDTALGVESTNEYVIADDIIGRDAEANARIIAAAPELYSDLDATTALAEEVAQAISKSWSIYAEALLARAKSNRELLAKSRGERP